MDESKMNGVTSEVSDTPAEPAPLPAPFEAPADAIVPEPGSIATQAAPTPVDLWQQLDLMFT